MVDSTTDLDQYVQLVIRNVGGIAISLGGITINGQIHQLIVVNTVRDFPGGFPCPATCSTDGSGVTIGVAHAVYYGANGAQIIGSGDITIPPKGFAVVSIGNEWTLGSVQNIKVTTTAGTFAQQVVTSPAD